MRSPSLYRRDSSLHASRAYLSKMLWQSILNKKLKIPYLATRPNKNLGYYFGTFIYKEIFILFHCFMWGVFHKEVNRSFTYILIVTLIFLSYLLKFESNAPGIILPICILGKSRHSKIIADRRRGSPSSILRWYPFNFDLIHCLAPLGLDSFNQCHFNSRII